MQGQWRTKDEGSVVTVPEGAEFTLAQVRDALRAEVHWVGDLSARVRAVGAADLMSDVLALGLPGMLLLTGLTTTQVVHTAVIADLAGVVLVRGKRPATEVVELARQMRMPLLSTRLTMFEAAGVLYAALPR